MASTRFFFPNSILLLSLLAIASAGDYGYTTSNPKDSVQTENGYDPKPKPNLVKPDDYPNPKPEVVKPDVNQSGPKPSIDQPNQDSTTPNYGYTPNPDHFNPKDTLPKSDYGHVPQPKPETVKPDYGYVPKPTVPKLDEKALPIGIEGLVLCRSGSNNYTPIKGAVARIICWAVDQNGYETTPYSCLTSETDAKGYFFKTFASEWLDQLKVSGCKVTLESSPLEDCNVPTDVNKGIAGALLSSYRVLETNKLKLYSVGPFFFTPETQSIPTPTTGY